MSDNVQAAIAPSQAPKGWRGVIRGNVLAMGLVSLLTDFSSEMMNPIIPLFFAGLVGGSEGLAVAAFWVGLSEGVADATASLLKIFSGRISDKLGKRKALVMVGYGLSAVFRPLTALAGAPWHVVALKAGDRVGKGIRTSPRDALISDAVDAGNRGLAFSFHRAMDHLGAVLGPLVVLGVLYVFLGYARWGKPQGDFTVSADEMHAMRVLFALAIIPGLGAMAALVFKVREIAPAAPGKYVGQGLSKASVWKQLPGRFYAFVGLVTLFALGNSSDMFLLLYARELFHLDLAPLVLLWIVLHVSKIVFSLPGGVVSDRIGRRPVIVAGWIVYALIYLGMAQLAPTSPQWHFWALFIAYGFYFGMTEGAEKALVADFIPSELRGTAFGVYHGAMGLAALPASLIFGVFWKLLGPQVAFGIGAALAGVAAIGLVVLLSVAQAPRQAKAP